MRIILIRHGDPDYEADSLTPKGWREAELLAQRLAKYEIKEFYCSPLGRAKDTASLTLGKMGREAEICDWLREFDASVLLPDGTQKGNCWDLMPSYWTGIEEFYDRKGWLETELMHSGPAKKRFRQVADGIDGILARHGYLREGNIYGAALAGLCRRADFGDYPLYGGAGERDCEFPLSVVRRPFPSLRGGRAPGFCRAVLRNL